MLAFDHIIMRGACGTRKRAVTYAMPTLHGVVSHPPWLIISVRHVLETWRLFAKALAAPGILMRSGNGGPYRRISGLHEAYMI